MVSGYELRIIMLQFRLESFLLFKEGCFTTFSGLLIGIYSRVATCLSTLFLEFPKLDFSSEGVFGNMCEFLVFDDVGIGGSFEALEVQLILYCGSLEHSVSASLSIFLCFFSIF